MDIQLLTNEKTIKGLFPAYVNLAGEYLSTAMFEAQEIHLKRILGEALLASLKAKETAGTLAGDYLALKNECQTYLAYQTIVQLIPNISFKLGNMGAVKSTDEKVESLSQTKIDERIEDFQSKADAFCNDLQHWVLNHKGSFAELTERQCNQIRANLYSSATCGIWLGGYRGY